METDPSKNRCGTVAGERDPPAQSELTSATVIVRRALTGCLLWLVSGSGRSPHRDCAVHTPDSRIVRWNSPWDLGEKQSTHAAS